MSSSLRRKRKTPQEAEGMMFGLLSLILKRALSEGKKTLWPGKVPNLWAETLPELLNGMRCNEVAELINGMISYFVPMHCCVLCDKLFTKKCLHAMRGCQGEGYNKRLKPGGSCCWVANKECWKPNAEAFERIMEGASSPSPPPQPELTEYPEPPQPIHTILTKSGSKIEVMSVIEKF